MLYGISPSWRTNVSRDVNSKNDGKEILIGGWVQQIRDKGRLIFLTIRDQAGVCQVTLHQQNISPKVWETCKDLTLESVVSIKGIVKADPRSKLGAELTPSSIIIHAKAAPKVPIDLTKKKTKMDIDTVFAYRELSIRDPEVTAVMELKSLVAKATRTFFQQKGFTEIFTPFILTTSTEGGAEQFNLRYFDQPAVLAQSCQFYKQAALSTHEKVFGIIPSWRAEKSHTPKHITEFWQIENEIAFATDAEIIKVQEDLIVFVIKSIISEGKNQLEFLNRTLTVPKSPFKKIPFSEAKLIVQEAGVEEDPLEDFGAPGETALSKSFDEPFFITEFPTHLRGMYYASNPDNPEFTRSLDLMAPEGFGGLSGGGQRVADFQTLEARIKKQGFDLANFEWYLRMFKFGMPPHAGFGLGFERLIRWLANLHHIREACLFPRTPDIYQP